MVSTEQTSELIGSFEAAKILKVSVNTIHRWVKEGRLKADQKLPSGYLRFNRAEVNRLREQITVR